MQNRIPVRRDAIFLLFYPCVQPGNPGVVRCAGFLLPEAASAGVQSVQMFVLLASPHWTLGVPATARAPNSTGTATQIC